MDRIIDNLLMAADLIPDYKSSFPIASLDQIQLVIDHPPPWTHRFLPLHPRSPTIVENALSDCHRAWTSSAPRPRIDRRLAPRTLVCHDYQGGYLEDRHLGATPTGNLYSFYNWRHIDIFVYFSHQLITIPPLAWTNIAHKNGVKILGTLITEGDAGKATCAKIFADEETMRIFVAQLVKLATIFHFDGWLLNIENSLLDTALLQRFVEVLTLKSHEADAGALVIWYDSVVETGALAWQNELNMMNRCFFERCDGIFLNYVWDEKKIEASVAMAGHRTHDVYVGVDVFGRNTFGGGNFNTYKAAQVIRKFRLSMALFAVGWTHETLPKSSRHFEAFINRDSAFWNTLWPYLYTHPVTRCFQTTFSLGTNQHELDLLGQEQQLSKLKHPKSVVLVPNLSEISNLRDTCNCLQCFFHQSGVNLLISKQNLDATLTYVHNLFICDIFITKTVSIYYLSNESSRRKIVMSLVLMVRCESGALKRIYCNGGVPKLVLVDNASEMEVNRSEDGRLINHVRSIFMNLVLNRDVKVVAFQFRVPVPCTLLEIGCVLEEGGAVNVCAFGIDEGLHFESDSFLI